MREKKEDVDFDRSTFGRKPPQMAQSVRNEVANAHPVDFDRSTFGERPKIGNKSRDGKNELKSLKEEDELEDSRINKSNARR